MVVSSEIEEVLGLADRVLVVADGRVVHDGPRDRASTSTACSTSSWKEAPHERARATTGEPAGAADERPAGRAAPPTDAGEAARGGLRGAGRAQPRPGHRAGRCSCIVGVITAGDRFASTDNVLTILRLASVIGVVSIGMTFVITGGGIDLSVGAIVGAGVGVGDHAGTQTMADDIALDRHGLHARCWSAPARA